MSKSLGKTDPFSLFTVPNTLQLSIDIPRFTIYVAFQDCYFLGEVCSFKLFLRMPELSQFIYNGFATNNLDMVVHKFAWDLRSQNS